MEELAGLKPLVSALDVRVPAVTLVPPNSFMAIMLLEGTRPDICFFKLD